MRLFDLATRRITLPDINEGPRFRNATLERENQAGISYSGLQTSTFNIIHSSNLHQHRSKNAGHFNLILSSGLIILHILRVRRAAFTCSATIVLAQSVIIRRPIGNVQTYKLRRTRRTSKGTETIEVHVIGGSDTAANHTRWLAKTSFVIGKVTRTALAASG